MNQFGFSLSFSLSLSIHTHTHIQREIYPYTYIYTFVKVFLENNIEFSRRSDSESQAQMLIKSGRHVTTEYTGLDFRPTKLNIYRNQFSFKVTKGQTTACRPR